MLAGRVRTDHTNESTHTRIDHTNEGWNMTMNERQLEKVRDRDGFIAALDQSGGSTPKALRLYGVDDGAWSGDDEMFSIVHEMRTRIVTSPRFDGDRRPR